jgi:hypothetical protein
MQAQSFLRPINRASLQVFSLFGREMSRGY